jgi:aquaporin Z
MKSAQLHWREWSFEALGLGLFMLSAVGFTSLLEHSSSAVRAAVTSDFARRALMGLAMGATAVALIYSPWGRRSGAHNNPCVTLIFWRLGRLRGADALGYALAQCLGAVAGVGLGLWAGLPLEDPNVNWAVTVPGPFGAAWAFLAECAIAGLLMGAVLCCSARPRLEPFTGWVAGACVALFISFEAPLSGMSMNPARSLGSALFAGRWDSFWIYLVAPALGMLLAARCAGRVCQRGRAGACAKLRHCPRLPCIFCGYQPARTCAPIRPASTP